MVKKEYFAYSYAEAVAAATAEGYTVYCNKTTAWKKAGSPTGEDLKAFAEETLKNNKKTNDGEGFMLAVESGHGVDLKRPYDVKSISNKGTRRFVTIHEVVRTDTGEVLGSADSKNEGLKVLKECITEHKTDCKLIVVKRCASEVEAIGTYTPSENETLGTYVFIGNERF